MPNSSVNRINIFLTVICGILFGRVLIRFLPLAVTNIFFILAIPFVCAFFLLMVTSIRSMLIVLLFLRALLDPLLNVTKLNIFGEDIGIGGAINFFIIILAVILISRNPKRFLHNSFYKYWIVFLFICGIAVIYSPVPGRAARTFLNLASYMSMAIFPFFIVNSLEDKKFWLKILLFASFLPVGFANMDLLRGGTSFIDIGMRIKGTFTHPNILAFYLVLTVVMAFYVLKSGLFTLTRAKKNLLCIYILNLLILLLATKTRNAWIACWVTFFTYGLLKEKKYLVFSVILPFLLLLHPGTMRRIQDLFTGLSVKAGVEVNSLAWRVELWKSSLPLIKKKFIYGHGLASFKVLSRDFFIVQFWERKNVPSHNSYLELLFETGVVGLVSYVMVFLYITRRFFSRIGKVFTDLSAGYALIFAYVVSYMIICLADNMLYYLAFNWYFWFFIGLMLRGMNFDDEKKDIRNNSVV